MRTLEAVALGILGVTALVVVLQRGSSAASVINAIASGYGGIVKTLTTAPK